MPSQQGGHSVEAKSSPCDAEEEEEVASLDKKYAPRDCLRCRSEMKHAGEKEIHEGGPGALLLKYLSLDMYVCPECLHVEFVAS